MPRRISKQQLLQYRQRLMNLAIKGGPGAAIETKQILSSHFQTGDFSSYFKTDEYLPWVVASGLGRCEIVQVYCEAMGTSAKEILDRQDFDGTTALSAAALCKSRHIVTILLAAGATSSQKALLEAILHNDDVSKGGAEEPNEGPAIVKDLLAAGATASEQAMIEAVQQCHVGEVVGYLLTAGAVASRAVFLTAIQKNHDDLIPPLLAAGAIASTEALLGAVSNDNKEITACLIAAGAVPSEEAIMRAMSKEKGVEMVDLLLQTGVPPSEKMLLEALSQNYDQAMIRRLIDAGVPLSQKALLFALSRQDGSDVAYELVRAGATPCHEALTEALSRRYSTVASALVFNGALPTEKHLMKAYRMKMYDTLKLLVGVTGDFPPILWTAIDEEDSDALEAILVGSPPLLLGLVSTLFQQDYRFCRDTLRRFVKGTLEFDTRFDLAESLALVRVALYLFRFNSKELFPSDRCTQANFETLELLLEAKMVNQIVRDKLLCRAAGNLSNGVWIYVQLLLRYGANTEFVDIDGSVAISNAIKACRGRRKKYNISIVKALLEAGASPDTPATNGDTLLIRAVHYKDADVVKLLLDHGADVKKKGRQNATALHWASYFGRPDIVRLLVLAGASTFDKTSYGHTVFDLARLSLRTMRARNTPSPDGSKRCSDILERYSLLPHFFWTKDAALSPFSILSTKGEETSQALLDRISGFIADPM